MLEIVWQYAPERQPEPAPVTAAEAVKLLDRGNAVYAGFTSQVQSGKAAGRHVLPLGRKDLGIPAGEASFPAQEPFVAFLGCADARVPLETIFGIRANGAFVARVAGNVLGNESLGSLEFAVANLPTLRLVAIVGHTDCGAVTAAADAFLEPAAYPQIAPTLPLRAIVDSLTVPVRAAAAALLDVYGSSVGDEPGYRKAVIELAIALNAALTTRIAADHFAGASNPSLNVVFGVFNLQNRRVGLPGADEPWQGGLFVAPIDQEAFHQFSRQLASTGYVQNYLLNTIPKIH